jgi:deoxyribodipyrimidine photo-lyase
MIPQLVWFKRDLRLSDHAALAAAAAAGGPVLPLFIVEPEYWAQPDVSGRQWDFWRGCVDDLSGSIRRRGGELIIRQGDAVSVLAALRDELGDFALHSHEETGNAWTYDRDRSVKSWCSVNGVDWREYRQFGVVRGPKLNRNRWAAGWDAMMEQDCLCEPSHLTWVTVESERLPTAEDMNLLPDKLKQSLSCGRDAAEADLWSFLHERGEHYTREMSSPVTAEVACSRLSAHLAYGTLSMREVTQAAWARYPQIPATEKAWRQSIRSFIARLHWHCHFIQKLESEPSAEYRAFARVYDGLRPRPADPDRLSAWESGQTGYPFIDAAMRYLNATGWINFRMRAMLMSFASYDLWLPWQESGLLLARKFVDYEPGIHWPQCQMQAGETGINTVRIYSPVKQGHDQDPDGRFVRQWVPELKNVPDAYVHEPWRLTAEDRAALRPDYPSRVVDHATAAKAAKDAIFALRRKPEAREEARAVVLKHGSRKRNRDRIALGKKADNPQLTFNL